MEGGGTGKGKKTNNAPEIDSRVSVVCRERLGIADPSGAIFVGDKQLDDVVAAKALGMRTALVSNKPLDRYGAQPTYHFRTLEPLLRHFQQPYWGS